MSRLVLILSLFPNVEKRLQKWINALSNPDDLFHGMVLDNEATILDLNTSQLEQGMDALGNFLTEYMSDAYAEFKQHLNSQPPLFVPDLKLEGNFHDGFILKWEGKEVGITSTDHKTDKLIKKYGSDIFGLTDESMSELKDYMLESFITLFRNELR